MRSCAAKRLGIVPVAFVLAGTALGVAIPAGGGSQAEAQSVTQLPLRPGYYVETGTPCAQASNATLSLLRRNGISLSPRELCIFRTIEKTDATTYRVTMECRNIAEESAPEIQTTAYEIADETQFAVRYGEKVVYRARFCAQPSLPRPWRSNDIKDLIR